MQSNDLENDRTEVQMLLDFVQHSVSKEMEIELLPFSPDKHRKPSDPEFIDINPKQSMFNMIRPTTSTLPYSNTERIKRKIPFNVFHYDSNRKLTIKELKKS